MAEREKYEQWLDDLEAKKDSTPTKVFDRVRHDYVSRLQTVMDQLKQHTGALREHAANLVAKLRELESGQQVTRDGLAEAELRAKVGEITSTEWDITSRKAQRELTKLEESQDAVVADLNRIREILGDPDDDGDDEEYTPRTSADFDELAFLKSVVGTGTTGALPKAAPVRPREPAKPELPPEQAIAAAAAAVDKAPQPPPAAAVPKPAAAAPAAPAAPAPAAPPAPPPAPENALGRTSDAVEQPKALKCTECGAMNHASEWYCERCGAELTVV